MTTRFAFGASLIWHLQSSQAFRRRQSGGAYLYCLSISAIYFVAASYCLSLTVHQSHIDSVSYCLSLTVHQSHIDSVSLCLSLSVTQSLSLTVPSEGVEAAVRIYIVSASVGYISSQPHIVSASLCFSLSFSHWHGAGALLSGCVPLSASLCLSLILSQSHIVSASQPQLQSPARRRCLQ